MSALPRTAALATVLAALGALPAADEFDFIQASLTWLPGAEVLRERQFGATVAASPLPAGYQRVSALDGDEVSWGLQVGWRGFRFEPQASTGYAVFAGGGFTQQRGSDPRIGDATAKALGVHLGLDGAWRSDLGDAPILLTAGARMGFALAQQDFDLPALGDATGVQGSFGVQLGAYKVLGRAMVGIEAGYSVWASRAVHDYNQPVAGADSVTGTGEMTVSLRGHGPTAGLVVGWRF